MTGDRADATTVTPDERAQTQALVHSRIAILEALIALRPLLPEIVREAASCSTPDEFASLIAARLEVPFSVAKVVANTRFETLATGFALDRLQSELADLRRLQSGPSDQAGG